MMTVISEAGIRPFGIVGRLKSGPLQPTESALQLSLSTGMSHWDIRQRDGALAGRVYGHLLHTFESSSFAIDDGTIHVSVDVPDAVTFEKQVLDHLHGLFLVETFGALPRRLYQDAGGSIPVVYCARSRRLGSSAGMMFDDEEYAERFARQRHQRLIEREISGSWIVGRATAHHGLHRLLLNFYLDLTTWTAHRFWPRRGEFELTLSLDEASRRVGRAMERYIAAAVKQYDLVCSTLTAGYDSRLILAAAHRQAHDIQFVTMGRPGAGIDQDRASELAAMLDLQHCFLPIKESSAAERELWDRCVGDAVSEVNRRIWPTLRQIEGDLLFTGMYGETGRCRLYRYDARTINDKPATAAFVVSRLTLPVDEELQGDIEDWAADLSWLPRSAVLDLAFNELRFGCWAMTQAPIQQAAALTMMPFAQRQIQDAFMSVPPHEKGTEALFRRAIEMLWPESLALRINAYGDYRDYTHILKKALKKDHLVRFARDRFAGFIR